MKIVNNGLHIVEFTICKVDNDIYFFYFNVHYYPRVESMCELAQGA